MTRLLDDIRAAIALLTRLPLPGARDPANLTRGVWAFPIVGLAVGGMGGVVYWLVLRLAGSPWLGAIWAVAATMLITGALHEDGLADTADGFGGGATPERKLAIMRDSHVGAYGVLALIVTVTLRVAAVAALNHPSRVWVALALAGMLGRTAILVLLLALRPARNDGLGAALGRTGMGGAAAGLASAVIACLLIVPFGAAIWIMIAALCASLAVARLARGQVDGYTGDVLGAGEVVVECVALTAFAAIAGA